MIQVIVDVIFLKPEFCWVNLLFEEVKLFPYYFLFVLRNKKLPHNQAPNFTLEKPPSLLNIALFPKNLQRGHYVYRVKFVRSVVIFLVFHENTEMSFYFLNGFVFETEQFL